ncbi:VTC domain-containing protein [Cokeromyces recurvatus]|uniref:VTC domain-containing protein n=1 Tax=Cokeromyces recurvatus TaxID=90255 RepID=UPI0022204287|nr:VTC domain-containing protein [Cokeromyces recurvatus]KAI7898476.1 VTC domain-containing protein [Cokeromyces recurvatus]
MSFLLEFKENIYKPWENEYVAYEAIYDGLYNICDQGLWSTKDERDFESAIRLEVEKVDIFINKKQREIETKIGYCQRMLDEQTSKGIFQEVLELSRYTRFNFKALKNLIEEHNQLTLIDSSPLLVEIIRTRPLDTQRFDSLLIRAASLIDTCCKTEMRKTQTVRRRARYWVHIENITEVKAILLFNLPLYTDDSSQDFEQHEQRQTRIYFDNDKLDHYASRLQYDDVDESIQCYWNGELASVDHIFIEYNTFTKTSHGAQLMSEKIAVDKDQIEDFLMGNGNSFEKELELVKANDQSHAIAARSIQETIVNKRLEAKLRVSFNHLSFKSSQSNSLVVSLDTEMAFVREDEACDRSETWYQDNIQYPFKSLDKNDVYLFPYAILEVQAIDDLPSWLTDLLNSKLVYEIPRFSKYVHGVAQFWSSQLPLLPWWLSQIDFDIRNVEKRDKWMMEGSNEILKSSSHSRINLMGYLESQLGIKSDDDDGDEDQQKLVKYATSDNDEEKKENTEDLFSVNNNKEVIVQVEDTAAAAGGGDGGAAVAADSTSYMSFDSSTCKPNELRSRVNSKSSKNHRAPSFLDIYNDKRSRQSMSYMLQDINTVNQKDALRTAAVIEMGEEKEKTEKKKKKLKPVGHRLEPKLFFANERTFIHWLQFAALILTAALTLLNFGDYVSTVAGGTFFGISLVIALYAFFRYRLRAYQMSTRPDVRYDDIYGPIGLCCLILGAMVLNFILRWEHPPSSNTYLGIDNKTEQQSNNNTI